MTKIDNDYYYTMSDLGSFIEINEKLAKDRRSLLAEIRKIHEITEKIILDIDSEPGISCNIPMPKGPENN